MPDLRRPLDTRDRFAATFGSRPVRRAEALAAGFSRGQLRAALARGLLTSPRHGVVAFNAELGATVGTAPPGPQPDAHVAALRAALESVGDGALASHDSAAILLGLARPSASAPSLVTLVRPGAADSATPGLRIHGSGVPHHQRTAVHGIPTTDLRRTAIDLARGRRLPESLIPLDSAARLLAVEMSGVRGPGLRRVVLDPLLRAAVRDELASALSSCFGWPGTVAVREALPFVDPAAESPLESRSRGWFIEAGIRTLLIGTEIHCAGATYWADFCEPDLHVIGEADGWGKYGDTALATREVVELERQRQRDLEAAGWTVVRWLSTDRRPVVIGRMLSALGRA
ncbi:MAG: hypothetical protein M0Z98_06740 [Actinomycetales bacterium]|nr:hypothetical protein [Actinomycetales bacterium]